ncbi:MAG: VWA domain-containing protein [Vicinamibacterales bacterium]
MTLTSPAALWLLALAVLLLFARRRRPAVRTRVGTLALWQQISRNDASRLSTRVRRHWLLVLQVLVVVAAVLALARPMLSWQRARVALVVDTSSSMGAAASPDQVAVPGTPPQGTVISPAGPDTRLDAAVRMARAWVDDLPRSTRVVLWTAGGQPVRLGEWGPRDDALRDALDTLAVTAQADDIQGALRVAAAADDLAEALVVSDRAAPDTAALPRRPAVSWRTVGESLDNVAVATIGARRVPGTTGGDVLVRVRNDGDAVVDTVVELRRDDQVVETRPLRVLAHADASVVIPVLPLTGLLAARVAPGDGQPLDDVRRLLLPDAEQVRVVVTGEDYFVERALRANPFIRIEAEAATSGTRDTADTAPGTRDRAVDGATVFVCIGCSDVPDNRDRVLLVRTAPAATDDAGRVGRPGGPHPLARALEAPGLEAIAVRGPDTPGALVIATAGDWPLLTATEQGDRRMVELRLDPGRSPLVLDPAFPLLVADVVSWLAERERLTLTAGDPLGWALPAGEQGAGPLTLERPDGTSITVRRPLGAPVQSPVLTTGAAEDVAGSEATPAAAALSATGDGPAAAATRMAGLYRLRGDGWERRIVVNPVVEGESDLSAAGSSAAVSTNAPMGAASDALVAGTNAPRNISGTTAPDASAAPSMPARAGQAMSPGPAEDTRGDTDLSKPLVVVALGLLAGEWWVRRRREGRA